MATKQQTLASAISFSGKGLHTGLQVDMTVHPAEENTGIIFRRVDLEEKPEVPALCEYVTDTSRGTTIEKGAAKVSTIEHIMSALWTLGVDNAIIDINAPETPIMDGSAKEYAERILEVGTVEQEADEALRDIKQRLAEGKEQRRKAREEGIAREGDLILASQRESAEAQREKRAIKARIEEATTALMALQRLIDELKQERQQRSAELQTRIFQQFRMLNAEGVERDLCDLFAPTAQQVPPAGAGECAAPKLLQYAYKMGMRPIAMAEFWWGASPKGEVRQHGLYYPACNGKCKPILEHMLVGLAVEPNPLMAIAPPEPKVVWEDKDIVVIDKPSGMLSVRGKSGVRSAEEWAQERYPEAMIVHRLDQSTSGILVIAKHKMAHEALQKQFVSRTVKKSYVALLEGVVQAERGEIRLPLKLDYENRPRQMVAEDGRAAHTIFEVEGYAEGRTRIRFYPITGRTHQLRVHAAHAEGLNTPIVGDDIYGTSADRLMLHAETIEFEHPTTGEVISLVSRAEF